MERLNIFSTDGRVEKSPNRSDLITLLIQSSGGAFSTESFPAIINYSRNKKEYKFQVLQEKIEIFSSSLDAAGISYKRIAPKAVLFIHRIPMEISREQLLKEIRLQESSADLRIFSAEPHWKTKSGKIYLDPAAWKSSISDLKMRVSAGEQFSLQIVGFPMILIQPWVDRGDSGKIRKGSDTALVNVCVSPKDSYASKAKKQEEVKNGMKLTSTLDILSQKVTSMEQNSQKSFLYLTESMDKLGTAMISTLSQVEQLHQKFDLLFQSQPLQISNPHPQHRLSRPPNFININSLRPTHYFLQSSPPPSFSSNFKLTFQAPEAEVGTKTRQRSCKKCKD